MEEHVTWERTSRTAEFHGIEDHSFHVYRNANDDRDDRVMVPAFRVKDDPELEMAVYRVPITEGPGGMDVHMIPAGIWDERVTFGGKLK